MCFRGLAAPVLLCVLSSFVPSAGAQQPGNSGSSSLPSRTVSGVVLNSLTGQPISRALVQAGPHATLTDSEGRFEFSDVTEVLYPSASKPGYFPDPGSMAAVQNAGPIEIRLVPEAIVSGQVTDSSGEPIEGIPVQLRQLRVMNGMKRWELRANSNTNAEGEYRFAELEAGDYAIRTEFHQDGPPEGEAAAGYVPVDFLVPGTNGTGALQVHAGDHVEADMSTHLERLYPVSVAVNSGHEYGFSRLSVRTAEGGEIDPMLRRDPSIGGFRAFLPAGSFELRVDGVELPAMASNRMPLMHGREPRLMARKFITVAPGTSNAVQMTLEPMARIDVEVAEEKVATPQANANAPPPSMGVRTFANTQDAAAQDGPQAIGINLVPTDPNSEVVGYWAEGLHEGPNMRADAPRVFRNVPAGKYLLQAGVSPPWYLASASCGGTDLIREPLVIAGSAAGCSIRAVFRNDAASLKVSVSHAGAGLVFVYAIPLDNLTHDVRQLSISADGKDSLDDLAPGRYLLLAMRRPEQFAFRDADTLRRYETEGKRVDLAPGATADVQLDLVDEEPTAQ